MKEQELVLSCLKLLASRGCMAWRNNTGKAVQNGRLVHYGQVGSSDILGCMPGGRFIGVECKVGRRRLTREQEMFLANVVKRGGLGLEIRAIEELDMALDAAGAPRAIERGVA